MRDPTVLGVEEITGQRGDAQAKYLDRFDKAELYREFSGLQDIATTSQGAESQNVSSLRNRIPAVEPQKMLSKVLLTQRSRFFNKQSAALNCTQPVPTHVERLIATLIQRPRVHQHSVTFIEATFYSHINAEDLRGHRSVADREKNPRI